MTAATTVGINTLRQETAGRFLRGWSRNTAAVAAAQLYLLYLLPQAGWCMYSSLTHTPRSSSRPAWNLEVCVFFFSQCQEFSETGRRGRGTLREQHAACRECEVRSFLV